MASVEVAEQIKGDDVGLARAPDLHAMIASQITDTISVDSKLPATQLDQEVEVLSAKIAEFVEVVENIRSDTKIGVNTTLPQVTEKALQLETTFQRIDALEVMVRNIDAALTQLEQQADHAESQLNAFASLKKKFFGALSNIGRKHQDTSPRYRTSSEHGYQSHSDAPQYQPVEIFKTSDYFQ